MSTLTGSIVSGLLTRLYADAAHADPPAFAAARAPVEAAGLVTAAREYQRFFGLMKDAYMAVEPDFGRLLYMLARARRATTIVEFGTSFGISGIFLAAALRDNGGGRLITTELEPTKVARAQQHLEAAGLADLVEFRKGDALDTLRDGIESVDLLFLDGAKSLYLDILKLLECRLTVGAIVVADNAAIGESLNGFVSYVRDPGNGYVSVALPFQHRNEVSLRLG